MDFVAINIIIYVTINIIKINRKTSKILHLSYDTHSTDIKGLRITVEAKIVSLVESFLLQLLLVNVAVA